MDGVDVLNLEDQMIMGGHPVEQQAAAAALSGVQSWPARLVNPIFLRLIHPNFVLGKSNFYHRVVVI